MFIFMFLTSNNLNLMSAVLLKHFSHMYIHIFISTLEFFIKLLNCNLIQNDLYLNKYYKPVNHFRNYIKVKLS